MKIDSADGAALVTIPVEFSGAAVKDFSLSVREHIAKNGGNLVLDFSETEFVDSSAIGALVSLSKDFKESGDELLLRNLTGEVHELFVDTGLDKIFSIQTGAAVRAAEVNLFEPVADIKLDIVRENTGDVCLLHLQGVMNHPVGSQFFKQQMLLAMADYKKILLDFEELTFFDSLSVGVMLKMSTLLKKTGGSLRMCGANYIISDLFSILNIDHIIPFFNVAADALRDWN
ncbi:MAG: STAS domain-containing protein [Chitinivibrionales bacterium]|nr:STAS domain-containing protein [Chitinivibrionales bacterium]